MEIRPTSNNESALPYRAKKLMSQTVSIQWLALLHIPQLIPEPEDEILSRPNMYQEVEVEV